ncbi:hypothetical protein [uncultured Maribacter sp.]|uniref:hypothetical protein n=1 Tax=uncultured Maribacter sp. TaxID=431308 RepID=UPI00263230D1|nr:hypothetical protein [uncultured Maribacter sp.]
MSKSNTPKNNTSLSYKDKLMSVHRFYGVEIEYLEPKFNRVHYILESEFLNYSGSFFKVQLNRQKLYVNNKVPTKVLEVLADKCANVLYPLVLKVSFSGQIQEIDNYLEIQERWKALVPKIKKEYSGEIAENYMNSISTNMADQKIFLSKLRRDVVYDLLFPRLFVLGELNFEKDNCEFNLPHYAYPSGIIFSGKQEISKYPNSNNHIMVTYEGKTPEANDVIKKEIKNGQLNLKYALDNENASMLYFKGICEFYNPEYQKIEYKISRLKEMEITKKV